MQAVAREQRESAAGTMTTEQYKPSPKILKIFKKFNLKANTLSKYHETEEAKVQATEAKPDKRMERLKRAIS